MKHATMMAALKIERDTAVLRPEQRVMDPVVAELAGAKLMAALGIGHAYCKVLSGAGARRLDPREWIIKSETEDGGLHACYEPEKFSQTVVASAKVPGAVPLSFLREHFGIDGGFPTVRANEWGSGTYPMNGVIFKGKPAMPGAAEFYGAFVLPADTSAIRAAIKWDSEAMLKIHAARLFLSATCAHASNVLVNAAGQLFSIDHADVAKTDGSEIGMLFANVKPGTRAFDALHQVCTLSELAVREIFPRESAAYYIERLRKWRRNFSRATTASGCRG
jgi:hypothetical protein